MKKRSKFILNKYAEMWWTAENVKAIRPDWSYEECEKALSKIEKRLNERCIELGWEVLDTLLSIGE